MLLLLALPGLAAAACTGSQGAIDNLLEKMNNANGPSAGADYYKGAQAACLYIYVSPADTSESPDNDFSAKVAIHEYIHVLQQGFLTGNLNTLAAPADLLGAGRFVIRNPGNVPAVFGTKIKAALDAMPSTLKLLSVPTYVLLIDRAIGGVSSPSTATTEANALMQLLFNTGGGCPGVDFTYEWSRYENLAMAEGEAEYYAENVYIPANSAVQAWGTPYDGQAMWTQRVADNVKMLTAPNEFNTDRSSLHLGDGSGRTLEALETFGWRANPVGELTYHYLKTVWRPHTTHADLMTIWLRAATLGGYAQAFQAVLGKSWYQFVCDFENHHSIPSIHACRLAANPNAAGAAGGALVGGALAGVIVGAIGGAVGLGIVVYVIVSCRRKMQKQAARENYASSNEGGGIEVGANAS